MNKFFGFQLNLQGEHDNVSIAYANITHTIVGYLSFMDIVADV